MSFNDSSGSAPQSGPPNLIAQCYALLAQGLSPSTRRAYTTGQRLFSQFCLQSRIDPLPTTEWSLMLFATWLVSARHLAPSSVSVYLAAVRSLNIDRGFPDPMVSTPRLHRLIRGIKRSAAPSRLSRLPITAPLLSVIHRSLALDLFDHRMFWAACCLAFFGFLRVAEFTCPTTFDPSTHLTPADVSIADAGTIHLWLKTSKTDPFRQGVMLHIGSSGNPICPVVAVRSYLAIRGLTPGPLFITSAGVPLSPPIVNHWLRSIFTAAGYGSAFSSHSFRIGAATSAAAAGIPDHLIKTLGRWSSNAYQRYIRTSPDVLTAVARILS